VECFFLAGWAYAVDNRLEARLIDVRCMLQALILRSHSNLKDMNEFGNKPKNADLSKIGLGNVGDAYWNLEPAELVEHIPSSTAKAYSPTAVHWPWRPVSSLDAAPRTSSA
jgi:hypothetical protein